MQPPERVLRGCSALAGTASGNKSGMTRSRLKAVMEAGGLLLVSSLVALAVLEFAVRLLFGAPVAERMPLVRVRPDRETGFSMVPKDVHYTYQHRVELNSLGFRGPEVPPKAAGEYRIIALGDSHLYGQGLSDAQTTTGVVQKHLDAAGLPCRVRVINMGVRAYGIANELATLKRHLDLAPDHVVLHSTLNDFDGETAEHLKRRYQRHAHHDWYLFDVSDKPTEEVVRRWNLIQLLRKSALIMLMHDLYQAHVHRDNFENRMLRGERDADIFAKIAAFRFSLDEMTEITRRRGIELSLIPYPVSAQATQDMTASLYPGILRDYATQHALGFFDLLPVLRDLTAREKSQPLIPYDGHYDSRAHAGFGEAIAQWMRGRIRCETARAAGN